MLEFRFKPPTLPIDDAWQRVPIAPRHSTALGISFRTPQVAAFGLEGRARAVAAPYVSLSNDPTGRVLEPHRTCTGQFDTDELDCQVDAAERAGKQIVLSVGALKTFGYPEFFVPRHRLVQPLPEHTLIRPAAFPDLLGAATEFLARIVERYGRPRGRRRNRSHMKRSTRWAWSTRGVCAADFVKAEVRAVRDCDPSRPIMMNGFLPGVVTRAAHSSGGKRAIRATH